MKKSLSALTYLVFFSFQSLLQAAIVDVFVATGQSNAYWPPSNPLWYEDIENSGTYQFGHGVQDSLIASGLFSNPTVVIDGAPGQPVAAWWYEVGGPNVLYRMQFFDATNPGSGRLEAKWNEIIANGDTPRFRGLFWFQGESDGELTNQQDTSELDYVTRWNGLLNQLALDVGSSNFNFVVNTVGNSGPRINNTLTAISSADSRGVLFDTQVVPYRTNDTDIHGYDHYAVGQANAQLFINSFERPVDVFIIAGQSNANGQGLVSDLTTQQKSAQNAMFYNSWHFQAFNAESIQYDSGWLPQTQAGETRSTGNVSTNFGSSAWFGPELGFVSRAQEINLHSNPMAILKYAVDGSALTVNPNFSDWDLTATAANDGDCWRGFQAALSNAVAELETAGYTPHFKGMIWWQGENGTSVAGLTNFIGGVRNLLSTDYGLQNPTNFPVVITGNDFWGAGLKTGVADPDPFVGFIDSVAYGQIGGYANVHLGSGQDGNATDVTANGTNDMWDIGVAYADELAQIISGGATNTNAVSVIWDGGAGDGLWTSSTNWSGDTAPVAGDTITIDNGDTVNIPGNVFDLPAGITVNVSGNSQISNAVAAARLYGGMTFNFAPGSGISGAYIDLYNGTFNFDNGAYFIPVAIQHRGNTTYGITFGTNGFTTLTPGHLFDAGSEVWSNVTFNIDYSNYDIAHGNTVELFDYAGHNTNYNGAFNPSVQVTAGSSGLSGALSFDTSNSKILYTFNSGSNTVDVTWDGEAGDDLWTSPANWSGDVLPSSSNAVSIGLAASVTNGQNDFATLEIEAGAAVTFSEYTVSGNVITNAGSINYDGVYRLTGAPEITLTASGSFGSDITFLDTQGATINFEDGASFANPSMSFEHRHANEFGYKLSETGFTTLHAGTLYAGSGANWSNVTFNINVSEYNYSNGLSLVLADFSSHVSAFDGTFNPIVHIIETNGLGGELSFDTVLSQLILTIDPPGNDAPVAVDQTVSVPTNGPVAFSLFATDIEGSNLTYTVESQPGYGSLSGAAPNLIYTPTGGVFSIDSFTFTAFDGDAISNTGTVTIARIPYSDNELWATYHDAIVNDALNTAWLTNWVDNGIALYQIRYDLGELVGTRTNASPKIAAYYAHPVGGTNLPGLVSIHGGGQRAEISQAKYWAEQGYAAISINWGALPLLDGLPNTDWDGLPSGFVRAGVTNASFHNWCDPDVYDDGATLYDVPHPLNSSWIHNSYAGRRALTFLAAQSICNSNKLGVVGWSMGGRTTSLVATDPRLSAVGPGVGGTGFLYEDWWGLPGTARSTNGVDDVDLYKRTTASQSYWPDVTAPTHYLEAANDFNAPFDLVVKALNLIQTNVPQRLAFSPHFNHRVDASAYAASVLWQKAHLTETFDFPETAETELTVIQPEGVPRLIVRPDTNTTHDVVGVDIYYGLERDSRIRFWHDAQAVYTNERWEADCPIYDQEEMFVALGVVTYDIGFGLDMPLGFTSPWTNFTVASEVVTLYPPALETLGIRETAEKERAIDDFTRGYMDWWTLNADNPQLWQFWTRKLGAPSWQGPAGGQLAFDVLTSVSGNTLGLQLDTEQWNTTDATTYKATIPLPLAGTNSLSLPVSAFTNGNGVALTTWDEVKHLALLPGNMIDGGLPLWSGSVPIFSALRWQGGAWSFSNGVTSTWLETYGLPLNNAAVAQDKDNDGHNNGDEFTAGTHPVDPSSVFQVESSSVTAGEFVLKWQAVAGKNYAVDYKSALTDLLWTPVATGIRGVEPITQLEIVLDSSDVVGFFRVRLE